MLRPIARVPCWLGLQAGFELQLTLARWLCDPTTTRASVTEPGVRALHNHSAVKDWLWSFLLPRADQRRLLSAAISVVSHTQPNKQRLLDWLTIVSKISDQFHVNPPQWPAPPQDLPEWAAFKELMLAFYEKLNSKGLPFDATGQPTAGQGVTYRQFVDEFKATHSDRVCVVCGDHLKGVQVDHWVGKATYPVLCIAPDNLLPMCCECNEPPGKGTQPVFALGVAEAFQDWFHPHHRSGHGRLVVRYEPKRGVVATALNAADNVRTLNLDKLMKLSERWTREFKAEYASRQKSLRQLIEKGRLMRNEQDMRGKLHEYLDELDAERPGFEIHRQVLNCACEPDRLKAWISEL